MRFQFDPAKRRESTMDRLSKAYLGNGLSISRLTLHVCTVSFVCGEANCRFAWSVDTAGRFQQHPPLTGAGAGCRQGWLTQLRLR
jgi:hypothetical protein